MVPNQELVQVEWASNEYVQVRWRYIVNGRYWWRHDVIKHGTLVDDSISPSPNKTSMVKMKEK